MEQQILNYRIEGKSRVYLGVDPATGPKVAIKELLPHLPTLDDLLVRFRHEVQLLTDPSQYQDIKHHYYWWEPAQGDR